MAIDSGFTREKKLYQTSMGDKVGRNQEGFVLLEAKLINSFINNMIGICKELVFVLIGICKYEGNLLKHIAYSHPSPTHQLALYFPCSISVCIFI